MQKGSTHTRTVTVIVLLCVVVLAIVYVSHRKTPSPVVTPPVTATSTSTAPASTYGMSQYVDPTYGFSFWYPSALPVTSTATSDTTSFPGGTAVETLQIGPAGGTSVVVVNSPTSTITDEPVGHASPIAATEYSYDAGSSQWMVSYPEGSETGYGPSAPVPANVSKTTMSGLVMLPSGKRFDTTIIPLSTTQFLIVSDGGGSIFTSELAETVSLAGASVDPSAQATALETESSAYSSQ